MAFEHLSARHLPSFGAWLAALTFLAVAIVLTTALFLVGSRLERTAARIESSLALAKNELSRAERLALFANSTTLDADLYEPFAKDDTSTIPQRQRLVLTELFQVLAALQRGQTQAAAAQFTNLSSTSLELLLVKIPSGPAGRRMSADWNTAAATHNRLVGEAQTLKTRLKEVEDSLSALEDRFSLIATRSGELFSLEPRAFTTHTTLPVYATGVLQNIPQLKHLPDDIPDLIALRDRLSLVRGKVTLAGGDAHATFLDTLSTLKRNTESVVSEHTEKLVEQERQSQALRETRTAIEMQEKRLSDLTRRLISELTRPQQNILTPWNQLLGSASEKPARHLQVTLPKWVRWWNKSLRTSTL